MAAKAKCVPLPRPGIRLTIRSTSRTDKCLPQDGISIICVILRNIDAEAIDYDTLIYCYLKVCRLRRGPVWPVFQLAGRY